MAQFCRRRLPPAGEVGPWPGPDIRAGYSYFGPSSELCGAPLRKVEGRQVCPFCDLGERRPLIGFCPTCGKALRRFDQPCSGRGGVECGDTRTFTPVVVRPLVGIQQEAPAEPAAEAPTPASAGPAAVSAPLQEERLDAAELLAGIDLAPSVMFMPAAPSPVPDLDKLTDVLGKNLGDVAAWLSRFELPPELEALWDKLEAEIDADTANKLMQLDAIQARLAAKRAQAAKTRDLKLLQAKAWTSSWAVDRQLEGKKAEFEHFLGKGMAGPRDGRPGDLPCLEEEAAFCREVAERVDTILLAALCDEYDAKEALWQRYENTDHEAVFLSDGSMDADLATMRCTTNVAWWTTAHRTALVSVLKVGKWMDRPVFVFAESPPRVRKAMSDPDYRSLLDPASVLSRLALGEGRALEAREKLAQHRDMVGWLKDEDERRDDVFDGWANQMHRHYEAMGRPEGGAGSGALRWLSDNKWFVLAAGIAATAVTIALLTMLR